MRGYLDPAVGLADLRALVVDAGAGGVAA